ncbi:amidoligase family protein [Sulfurimonas sp. NW15]|uniref:amidoligase family protein n=1 Tax=Sulfurimonas sp. NW15 TaxID=2922729 RepID=UPI003DAA2C02
MNHFMQPPVRINASNELRKVGFELEYSAIELQKSAELLIETLESGSMEKINPYHYKIRDTCYGDFNLILDFQFLISQGLQKWLQNIGLDQFIETEIALALEEFIATLSQTIVPYEITTPPLPLDKIAIIEKIKETFRINGALGTDANPLYAFGFHINPQAFSFEVTEIIDTLRAFFILYETLVLWLQPDIVRRISPYIKPFEEEYIQKVLKTSYKPDMNRFICDYLQYNPTRNRALDLLPLLAWIDSNQVFKTLPEEKISPRPAYHYRLPNSKVDKKEWHTYDAWNSWVIIEKLAQDKEMLAQLAGEYSKYLTDPFSFLKKEKWLQQVNVWLKKQI